ncbi:MAG: hypothetical protein JSS79_19095 [Bacteroidetes bacterium]|nr:hypothetical protein [Bacteroidota bacterium]
MKNKLPFVLLVILAVTCKKEESTAPVFEDPTFKTYLDRFVSEANARGFNPDVSLLRIIYSDTLNYYCGYGVQVAHQVQISTRATCWAQLSDTDKEILMFHELGHAVLGRNHDNAKLANGDYKTMMFAGSQFGLYVPETPERRKYYLDELFNPSTPPPSWGNIKTTPTIVFSDTINYASNKWDFVQRAGSYQTGVLSAEKFVTAGHSLKMNSPSVSAFSYWAYLIAPPPDIKEGDRLVLSVKVRLEGVSGGNGVIVAFRGDSDSRTLYLQTTQGSVPILGTADFTEYRVELPYYINATSRIIIYLMMDGPSQGTAYFDDITLIKYE